MIFKRFVGLLVVVQCAGAFLQILPVHNALVSGASRLLLMPVASAGSIDAQEWLKIPDPRKTEPPVGNSRLNFQIFAVEPDFCRSHDGYTLRRGELGYHNCVALMGAPVHGDTRALFCEVEVHTSNDSGIHGPARSIYTSTLSRRDCLDWCSIQMPHCDKGLSFSTECRLSGQKIAVGHGQCGSLGQAD